MARISREAITRLTTEVSLVRLVEARGIALTERGGVLVGTCPFHEDKGFSLFITPADNRWRCRGACQSGGTVIDWVMKTEGVSFRHAVELLRNDYAPVTTEEAATLPTRHSTVPKLDVSFAAVSEDRQLLSQVIEFYHATLKQSPDALAYLEKRGIKSPEAITTFRLGYANRTLGYRLPQMNRKEGAVLRGQLQCIGIYRESGHEHFSGSLVIPVLDEQGDVVEVYGRKLLDNLRAGTPKHLYLPGPHRGVWNRAALAACKEIILCEALIDALTFWCAGYRNVTASFGVDGFTDEHLAAFKVHGTERVLIAYDRDAAGDAGAETLAQRLMAAGIDCYRVQFPKGMDANVYACQTRPAAESLGRLIRAAAWVGTGKQRTHPGTPETAEVTHDVVPAVTIPVAAAPATEDADPVDLAPPETPGSESAPEPVPVLPAAAVPPAPAPESVPEQRKGEAVITLDDRRYRIRGLARNLSFDTLRVNVLVSRDSHAHVDTLDLYQARSRTAFIKQAAAELGVSEDVVKSDLGKVLLQCEVLQEAQIHAAQQPKVTINLSEADQRAAMAFLRSPDLLARIQQDFVRCGLVGEPVSTLVAYLAAVSRQLPRPLAVIVQSASAAGKTSLMEAVLRFVPPEERVQFAAMTGQSLFYLGETVLKHKVLAIAEEQGAAQAAYALKLLQSEGELTIASTGKDPETGKLVTQQYRVEGPVMLLLTTTAIELDEELLNRSVVLTVNEDRAQTEAIHTRQRQRRTLAGLVQQIELQKLLTLHQNAQRLLKPLTVVNPYAERLTFLSAQTRTRRDHEKYLTLIDAIALLHQHQRPVKTTVQQGVSVPYVEVTLADIEVANNLAHEVLGRSLDELPPQTRRLLGLIEQWVASECRHRAIKRADFRFSRRVLRAYTGWSDGQLKIHCRRLHDLEYLLPHGGGPGRPLQYELLYDGGDAVAGRHLMGLIDVATLKHAYDADQTRQKGERTGSSQGQVGPKLGAGLGSENGNNHSGSNSLAVAGTDPAANAPLRRATEIVPYVQGAAPEGES